MQDGTGEPTPNPQPESPRDFYAERSQGSHLWYEIRLCLGYLTRLPVFRVEYSGHSSLASASWAFPIIGIFVGLVGALVLWLCDGFGLGAQLSALLAVAAITLLTGAFHEQGLATTAEGLGTAGDVEVRLAIMRDPRVGIFGIIALIVVFCGRWLALGDLIAITLSNGVWGMVAAGAISRGVLPFIVHAVANAPGEETGAWAQRPEARPAWIALAISAAVAWMAFGFGFALLILIVAGIIAFIVTKIAQGLAGGQSAGILSAIQQMTELAVLVTAAGLAT